jgi:hypothetical protein
MSRGRGEEDGRKRRREGKRRRKGGDKGRGWMGKGFRSFDDIIPR